MSDLDHREDAIAFTVAIVTGTTTEGRVVWELVYDPEKRTKRILAAGETATRLGALFEATMNLGALFAGMIGVTREAQRSGEVTGLARARLLWGPDAPTPQAMEEVPANLVAELIEKGRAGIQNASAFSWMVGLAKKINATPPSKDPG